MVILGSPPSPAPIATLGKCLRGGAPGAAARDLPVLSVRAGIAEYVKSPAPAVRRRSVTHVYSLLLANDLLPRVCHEGFSGISSIPSASRENSSTCPQLSQTTRANRKPSSTLMLPSRHAFCMTALSDMDFPLCPQLLHSLKFWFRSTDIRREYSSSKLKEPVLHELEKLRKQLKKRELEEELEECVNRIERQFLDVRDRLLTAAGPGLTMSVVIHEVEKGVSGLVDAVRNEAPSEHLSALANHLAELVDGLTYLTRRSGRKGERASVLIRQALFNTGFRIHAHSVEASNDTEGSDEDFSVKCTRRLIIASLMNLIDNSIYWLVNKGHKDKRIFIGTTRQLKGGPALIVADNGPGFSDPPT